MKNDMRKATKDQNCIKAVEAVFNAMALESIMRDIVVPIQVAALAKFQFKIADKWEEQEPQIILDPKLSYLLSDEDFEVFHAEIKNGYKLAGIAPKKEDNCPLLECEGVARNAKKLMVDAMEQYSGISYDNLMLKFECYNDYIELLLKLFASTKGLKFKAYC